MSTDPLTRPLASDTAAGRAPAVVTSRSQLRAARAAMTGRLGVVMTMGALHDGHLALLRAARRSCDHVLVTIFVNPLQFGPGEDLDRYPRTLDADVRCCAAEGGDVVFAPSVAVMYPDGEPQVRINPGPLGQILEGASRPGFFDGVLTVVDKLIGLTRPHALFFGEKDYQQLVLVRGMVRDLELHTDGEPIEVVAVPTAREPTGLARSSRNVYLSGEQRRGASSLSAALVAGAEAAARGPAAVLSAARGALADGVRPDYLVVTDPELGPAPARGMGRLLVAARVGDTRLIDNMPVRLGPAQG